MAKRWKTSPSFEYARQARYAAAVARRRQVLQEIASERDRQIGEEGFSREHDDKHAPGALALAGAAYAYWGATREPSIHGAPLMGALWPWPLDLFKPQDSPRRALVIAAALIAAEIEKLDRRALHAPAISISLTARAA